MPFRSPHENPIIGFCVSILIRAVLDDKITNI